MADEQARSPWWRSRGGLVVGGFLAVGGFLLLTEHAAHAFQALPYLLLLACLLMHLFMHRGHGHSHGHDHAPSPDSRRRDE
ncbi:MAG: DUF2933 domain-containing protein [Alphaproteobacteria bacterium]|nr:DUF2933 domain-containing protein [Alphaproteobacteria bacterium]